VESHQAPQETLRNRLQMEGYEVQGALRMRSVFCGRVAGRLGLAM
jgi:hypothetical protein